MKKIYIVAEIKDVEAACHVAGVFEYAEGTAMNLPKNAVVMFPATTKKNAKMYCDMLNEAIKRHHGSFNMNSPEYH